MLEPTDNKKLKTNGLEIIRSVDALHLV